MPKTAKEVVDRAVLILKVRASEDETEANVFDDAMEEYLGFHAFLRSEFPRQVNWDSDRVPDQHYIRIVNWFAWQLSMVIPVSQREKQNAENRGVAAEKMLRKMLARRPRITVEVQTV